MGKYIHAQVAVFLDDRLGRLKALGEVCDNLQGV